MEDKSSLKKGKSSKATAFSVKLSELRRERGISQKKASADLGISQALLSHYEKGIRECGLDFVIRCADYYGVTTDYLLGVSESRNGIDLNYFESFNGAEENGATVLTLSQATKILLDCAGVMNEGASAKYIHDYFMLCLYRGALTLAKAGVLPSEMFKIDISVGRELANAAISLQDAKFVFIEDKTRGGADFSDKTPLHTLIDEAETFILNNFVVDL